MINPTLNPFDVWTYFSKGLFRQVDNRDFNTGFNCSKEAFIFYGDNDDIYIIDFDFDMGLHVQAIITADDNVKIFMAKNTEWETII